MKNNVGVGVGVDVGVGVGVGVYVWEDVLEYVWECVAMNDWNWRCSTSKLELHVHHKQAGCSFSLTLTMEVPQLDAHMPSVFNLLLHTKHQQDWVHCSRKEFPISLSWNDRE